LRGLDLIHIPYTLNHRLVRGLDYYNLTTFEVTATNLGAQNAVGAGGRYDGLVETLSGPPTPAVGFAVGLERIAMLLPESVLHTSPIQVVVYVAAFGDKGSIAGISALEQLRASRIAAVSDFRASTLKAHLRQADRLGCGFTVILGDDEVQTDTVILRNMMTKDQSNLPLSSLSIAIQPLLTSSSTAYFSH
jgi:histidyl-tRNA synthetase